MKNIKYTVRYMQIIREFLGKLFFKFTVIYTYSSHFFSLQTKTVSYNPVLFTVYLVCFIFYCQVVVPVQTVWQSLSCRFLNAQIAQQVLLWWGEELHS